MIKIDKDIPPPFAWPWFEMEIGDSFEFPVERSHVARAAAHNHGLKYSKKFTTRGNRIWRIK